MKNMLFTTQEQMDKAIEAIIDNKVKAYKSDWTDYDRPKYEACKREGKSCILIARDCGTELYVLDYILSGEYEWKALFERFRYYATQDGDNEFYYVNTRHMVMKQMDDDELNLLLAIANDRFESQ